MNLQQHPLSAAYPSMTKDELAALANDIKAHGLHSSIVLYKGDVLDGWHRYLACKMVGANPRSIEYKGTDPVAFVESANEHRRHMTASQRGYAKVALNEWLERGRPKIGKTDEIVHLLKSNDQMADEARVSTTTIKAAKAVHANGADVLKTAVKEGDIPVERAAKIARLPKADQPAAMKAKPTKPEKPSPKQPEGAEFEPDILEKLAFASDQVRSQAVLIESLKKDDLAKEVAAWHLKFDQMNGRLRQQIASFNEVKKQADYQAALLSKIRTALKVKKDSEILPALKNCG